MALAQIGVGTVANDGTGDTIRAAFQKVNANNLLFGTVTQNNVTTTDPVAGSDNTAGYAAGSRWFNSTTGTLWTALSVGTGAAVWLREGYTVHPNYISGNWYWPWVGTPGAGGALVINTIRFHPLIPSFDVTLNSLGARCTTGGSTNSQFAIYASDPSTRKPTGSELGKTASIVNTGTGIHSAVLAGGNINLTAGVLYWLAINCGDSAATYAVPGASTYVSWAIGSATSTTAFSTSPISGLSTPVTFGTWGDMTSASWTETTDTKYAFVGFKVA